MPKKKVYIIVHDGTNVLIGQEGRSGKPPQKRNGYHLPGGSYEDPETPANAAVRELKEETGIELAANKVTRSFNTGEKGMGAVTFVVAKVADVSTLVENFTRPIVTNPYDEPFSSVKALDKSKWNDTTNFSSAYYTDWFGLGLKSAYQKHYLD